MVVVVVVVVVVLGLEADGPGNSRSRWGGRLTFRALARFTCSCGVSLFARLVRLRHNGH